VQPESTETLAAHRAALWQALITSRVGQAWSHRAQGCLGVLVSAGPSLARNGARLAEPRFADRRLLVATIDSVGPLVRLGVRADIAVACEAPRTVDLEAALEFGTRIVAWGEEAAEAVRGTGAFAVPCDARDGDETFVAHLLLRHIGCDPVALVGVDLAFIDGVAHAPGHALDYAWALETNPFRSWDWLHAQRIAMRAGGLLREPDRGGRSVLTDRMLHAERAVLEAAFDEDRRSGLQVIDATEGGCTKRHADQQPLRTVLERHGQRRVPTLPTVAGAEVPAAIEAPRVVREGVRAIAFVPVDPLRGGTGVERRLEAELGGRTVFRRTIERLLTSHEFERVVIAAPKGWDATEALDGLDAGRRVAWMWRDGPVIAGAQASRRASRAWSDACWRGGLGGRSVFDEVLAAMPLLEAMRAEGATEAFLCGPDWPLVSVREAWGADAMVRRARTLPERPWMQFAPGPAGASGCLLSLRAVESLARHEVASIGAWLDQRMDWSRRPERLRPPSSIALLRERVVMDTPRATRRLRRALEPLMHGELDLPMELMLAAVARQGDAPPSLAPQHLVLELNTGRRGCGVASPHRFGSLQRPSMTMRRLERVLARAGEARDMVVTLGGAGDPLIHPDVGLFIERMRAAGVHAIEVRTELIAPQAVDQLASLDVDVITVDLHAVDAIGYRAMMGSVDFQRSVERVHALLARRGDGDRSLPHPWILPRIERLRESVPWVSAFLQTWMHDADGAVVDPPPQRDPWGGVLVEAPTPASGDDGWAHLDTMRRMTVLSDGRVPAIDGDLLGNSSIGSVDHEDLVSLHRSLVARRREAGVRGGLALAGLG